jgi:MFS family permease
MDKFGFKKLMYIITIIEIIVGSSLYFIVEFGILFIIELILVSLCIGGTFTILTPIFIQIFGLYVGPELYGLTGISIGISNISGPLLMRIFPGKNSSFLIMFLIGTGFCIIKLIVLIFFDENNKMYNDNIDDIKKNIDMEMTDNSPINPINDNDSNEE